MNKFEKVKAYVDATLEAVNNNIGCEVGDEKIYIPHLKKVLENIRDEIIRIENDKLTP